MGQTTLNRLCEDIEAMAGPRAFGEGVGLRRPTASATRPIG